jgi:putative endonuclease
MDLVAEARRMVPSLSRDIPCVYILRLQSGLFYTGSSTDLELRLQEHQTGHACRTTKLDPPVSLLWIEIHPDYPSARKREAQLKKWPRLKKEALISGNQDLLRKLSKSNDQ